MMMMNLGIRRLRCLVLVVVVLPVYMMMPRVSAWVPPARQADRSSRTLRSLPSSPAITTTRAVVDRRSWCQQVGWMVVPMTLIRPAPAGAEGSSTVWEAELSMPEETPARSSADDEAAALAERLRIKAELQKKMAQPGSYKDSLQSEQKKQEQMKQRTKQERQQALCEELGRGC